MAISIIPNRQMATLALEWDANGSQTQSFTLPPVNGLGWQLKSLVVGSNGNPLSSTDGLAIDFIFRKEGTTEDSKVFILSPWLKGGKESFKCGEAEAFLDRGTHTLRLVSTGTTGVTASGILVLEAL